MTAIGRVTQRLMVDRSVTSLQTSLGRLSTTQEQVSTGRLINRPSDSPTGTTTAMQLRRELSGNEQHIRNAENAIGWLGQTDATVSSMLDSVHRSRELVLRGASTGSTSDASRAALATELSAIRDSLVSRANTTYLGRPLFGGTTAGATAYAPDGSYVGDAGTLTRTIGDQIRVQANLTGPQVFGTGADELFTVLGDAIDALRNNPTQLPAQLDRIDTAMNRMTTALAEVGTRYGRVEESVRLLENAQVDLSSAISEIEDVDIARAAVDLQMQEVAYQAALGATARVIQPSLLDFLR